MTGDVLLFALVGLAAAAATVAVRMVRRSDETPDREAAKNKSRPGARQS